MKLWTISDLHTENGFWVPREIPDADICVLAGDIGGGGEETARWAAQHVRPHMPVVAVLGNHAFYRGVMEVERRTAGPGPGLAARHCRARRHERDRRRRSVHRRHAVD